MARYLLLFVFVLLFSCSKDNDLPQGDVTFNTLPIPTVKKYIAGIWQAHYATGGIAGTTVQLSNSYFDLSDPDLVSWTSNGRVMLDCQINWVNGASILGSNTIVMQLRDVIGQKQNTPLIATGIYNDTLILDVDAIDGLRYHLTKR